MNELTKWKILLPTVELVINSLPNASTGFTPFYLNYGYELVTPIQLLKGDEIANIESVAGIHKKGGITTGNLPEKIRKGQYSCRPSTMTNGTRMLVIRRVT